MSEIVERVREAIDAAVREWQPGDKVDIKTKAARAAIEAMRVPTGPMAHAGAQFSWFEGRSDEAQAPVDVWQAMIDAALK